jgi:hypothetical protein
MNPKQDARTAPAISPTEAFTLRRPHRVITTTVSQADSADTTRKDRRCTPHALNERAISHTFNGGLKL